MKSSENEKKLAALEAVKFIQPGQVVGIGTGSTANYATEKLGELVKGGLQIKAVPTSIRTRELASSLGIPLLDMETVSSIDITIDGADEFTPDLTLIKGGGGALFREKIVASLTREQIIIADSSKQVEQLGKFKVPVEVVAFALSYVLKKLENISNRCTIREHNGSRYLTDQSNYIIDVDFGLINDPAKLSYELNQVEGIVCHGIFINLAKKVIMAKGEQVVVFAAE